MNLSGSWWKLHYTRWDYFPPRDAFSWKPFWKGGSLSELHHERGHYKITTNRCDCGHAPVLCIWFIQGHTRTGGFLSMPWVKLLSVTQWNKHIHTAGSLRVSAPPFCEETGALRRNRSRHVRTLKHHTGGIQLAGSAVCCLCRSRGASSN